LQLSDDGHLPADQRKLFSQMYSDTTQCHRQEAEHAVRAVPTIVLYLVQQQNMLDDAAGELIQQNISWGEFNRRRKDATDTELPRIGAALAELKHELQEQNTTESAQDYAAAQALMQYYQNQSFENLVSHPPGVTALTYAN
jgi:hypothetical protein